MEITNKCSKDVSYEKKEKLYIENKPIFDCIFYFGKGFLLDAHLKMYLKYIYGYQEREIKEKIDMLRANGLLNVKQATSTNTVIYKLTKCILGFYYNKPSKDVKMIKITNHKLWNNIFMNEYIIVRIIPAYLSCDTPITIDSIFETLEKSNITFTYTQERNSIVKLYEYLDEKFGLSSSESFLNDYKTQKFYAYNFNKKFNKQENNEDYKEYEHIAKVNEYDKDNYPTPDKKNMNTYNLYNMVMNGFFIEAISGDNIYVGCFETTKWTFEKVYKQPVFIYEMLKRYFSHPIRMVANFYIRDVYSFYKIKKQSETYKFDAKNQEFCDESRLNMTYQVLGFNEKANIAINPVIYLIDQKYNL